MDLARERQSVARPIAKNALDSVDSAERGKHRQENAQKNAATHAVRPGDALAVELAASHIEKRRPSKHDRRTRERAQEALEIRKERDGVCDGETESEEKGCDQQPAGRVT